MAERTTPPFKAALVFTDPTPNAIVNNRIAKRGIEIAQRYTDLTEEEQSLFFDVVILTSRKMTSVWKHLGAYRREEDRLLSEFAKGGEHIDYGQELFTEFDEFAVQIKSTLDHVVKATCDVRIVYSAIRHGSGDPVEPPEQDEQRDSYYLQYGGTEHRGVFIGGSGCFDTLEEAMRQAAQTFQNLVWDS